MLTALAGDLKKEAASLCMVINFWGVQALITLPTFEKPVGARDGVHFRSSSTAHGSDASAQVKVMLGAHCLHPMGLWNSIRSMLHPPLKGHNDWLFGVMEPGTPNCDLELVMSTVGSNSIGSK